VLRLLFARYGDESGVPENGIEAAANEVAGVDLAPFFDQALRSTAELDYSVFEHVGLESKLRQREAPTDKGGTPPRSKLEKGGGWLGIVPRGGPFIASVLDGSAAMEAGLYPEDEILALDGFKCDAPGLVARCEDKHPGDVVRITVFRRERLLELFVTLGARPSDTVWVSKLEKATDAQKASYAAWLGSAWDEESKNGTPG